MVEQIKEKTPEEKAADLANDINAKTDISSHNKNQKIVGLIAAILVVILVAYMWWPNTKETDYNTSTSNDFIQNDNDGFGRPRLPEPIAPVDPNPDLLAQIAALKQKIKDLSNRPAETKVVQDDTAINQLNDALENLKRQMALSEQNYQNSLSQAEIDKQRLQNELDALKLANGQTVDNPDAQKLLEEQILAKRVSSPLSPLSNSGGKDDGNKSTSNNDIESRRLSQNELFARSAASAATVEQAKIIVNPANTVVQGTVIQATLETAINTDLPSMIRAIISEDVLSFNGQRVLIPRGSKVIGRYNDSVDLGQSRVMIVWERIIMPDNQTVTINAFGGDPIGQAGIKGRVNSHFASRFGSATLISAIGIAPAAATAALTNKNDNDNNSQSVNNLASAISQNSQSSLSGLIGEYLRRKPTIAVHQGDNITIFVDRDLEIF